MEQGLLCCATRSSVITPTVPANVAVPRWWMQQKLFERVISGVQDVLAFFDIQDLCLSYFATVFGMIRDILLVTWVWFRIFRWLLGYDSRYFAGELSSIPDILLVNWVWFRIFCWWIGYDSGYFAGYLGMIPDILLVNWVWSRIFCWWIG